VADDRDLRLLAESVVLPPYRTLGWVPGFQSLTSRLQAKRYESVIKELHATLATTPLADHYLLSCGLLLGYRRENRALPWDCWDVDFEVPARYLPELAATVPLLVRAGWRHRVTWCSNDGRVAEVRLMRKLVGLDLFVTYDEGDEVASWVFSKRDGTWLQAEQRVPQAGVQEVEFLGLRWNAPDPIDPVLVAMYGDWQTPQPGWDYMTSPSIVDVAPWTRPDIAWP
jgi:hypothetical protein